MRKNRKKLPTLGLAGLLGVALAVGSPPKAKADQFYQGGPVISGTVHIHFIWYGDWAANSAPEILNDFVDNLSGTPYRNFLATYGQMNGSHASNSIIRDKSLFVGAPYGTTLTDANMRAIIEGALDEGTLPRDANAIYVIMGSKDVTAYAPRGRQFCHGFAAFHNHITLGDQDIKYAYVGDRSGPQCGAVLNQFQSPNGNRGADDMASLLAHETAESTADPLLHKRPAWILQPEGEEVGDLCEQGALRAPVELGDRTYLLQPFPANVHGMPGACAFTTPTVEVPVFQSDRHGDQLVTLNMAEAADKGYGNLSLAFNVFSDNQVPGTRPLFRCLAEGANRHFTSLDRGCDGDTNEGLLGFIYKNHQPDSDRLLRYYARGKNGVVTTTDETQGQAVSRERPVQLGYAPK